MQPNGNVPGVGRPVAGAPVSNVNIKPAPVPTPPPAPKPAEPAFGNGGSVVEGKGGKKTGWILAVVLLLIVAAGGVGFGVWAYMDGNAKKDALNEQISTLKQQNNELLDKVTELESKIENYENLNNKGENETGDAVDWSLSTAEAVDGVFYVKDSNGKTLAQSNVANVVEVTSCDYFKDNSVLKCSVTASDGNGWFLYSFVDEKLSSSFDL